MLRSAKLVEVNIAKIGMGRGQGWPASTSRGQGEGVGKHLPGAKSSGGIVHVLRH